MKYVKMCFVLSFMLLCAPNSFAQDKAAAPAVSDEMPMKDEGMPMNDMAEDMPMNMDMPADQADEKDSDDVAVVTAQASATIHGTAEGSPIKGEVALSETKDGVIIDAEVFNVPNPGPHGFHVHEKGSCDDGGKAAGGHFNPDSVEHGDLVSDGHMKAHAGDMGNITIDDTGHGTYTALLPGLSLTSGKYDISGLAIILHEKTDDFGQPTGNAGGRIGCGIITKK